LVHF